MNANRGKTPEEREVKLSLDGSFRMPTRQDLAPATVEDRGVEELRSVYWDTDDLALAQAHVGLRHRNGTWTYKGRSRQRGASVVREEREVDAAADRVPPTLAERVQAVAPVDLLHPVAELVNQRQTWMVRDGAQEVELVWDRVEVLRGEDIVDRFAEAEVEFDDESGALADQVVAVLRSAGATVSAVGKYTRALRALGLQPSGSRGDGTDAG